VTKFHSDNTITKTETGTNIKQVHHSSKGMKQLVLKFILIILFPISVFSQNLLDDQWQFSPGDNMAWKDPGFNSSGWVTIKSGTPWEEQGFKDYNGFAWYRKSIDPQPGHH
jgi:hypothetical protein